MKKITFIFCLIITTVSAQEKWLEINADYFVGVDNLENIYFIKNNVLHKKSDFKTITFNNLYLGKIDRVDITNPLKIMVFYKDFNSVIILDDQLNALSNTLDFNTILFKNIHFVGTSSNSNLWLFSKDDNSLMLYNYVSNKMVLSKQIETNFNYQTAVNNYHNIFLITNNKIEKYNAYLSFIDKKIIKNIENASYYNNMLAYKTNNNLYLLINDSSSIKLSLNKTYQINSFQLKNNLLYFFSFNTIYKLKLPKK